ncbi:MAG: hypothetical protein Q4C49_05000 [Bacillota bacterium]|nr:hypothetical protein [Bacillota bacterium]
MARNKNKQNKPKQGHKLVWFALIVIAIPCAIVAMVLLQSIGAQNNPVTGNRFSKNDCNPGISKSDINKVLDSIKGNVGSIENININLKSATLRININADDAADEGTIASMVDQAYEVVNQILPIDTYFTNKEDSKMYDLEINIYNWLVDDKHPEGQIYIQCTKTGAGNRVVDNLTSPKDKDLVNSITRTGEIIEEPEQPAPPEPIEYDVYGNPIYGYDEYGNPIYEPITE